MAHPWAANNPTLPADLVAGFPAFENPADVRPYRGNLFAQLVDDPAPPAIRICDWRARAALPIPRSQGYVNACTSFALCYAYESRSAIKGAPVRLAPSFIHTCLLGRGPNQGATTNEVTKAACDHGIALSFAGDHPYPAERCDAEQRAGVAPRTALRGQNSAMRIVLESGPVLGDMWIDPAFLGLARGEVYRCAIQDDRLHSVAVVGFNQDEQYWIVANSFGPGWANDGFCYVAFGSGGLMQERGGWAVSVKPNS